MENCKDCHNCAFDLMCRNIGDWVGIRTPCSAYKDRSQFVELPIKSREKVFYFDTEGRIYETTVTQLIYGASGFLIDSDVMFNSNLIGKRFFLTREAAEQALKEREKHGSSDCFNSKCDN